MTSHARLHVMLAREAQFAVVIRRGPSRQVCTLLWNRKTDRFTLGQWLKGKIYEFRGDISPDGTRWLYMAMKGGTPYTVIAAPPYLKAIYYHEHNTTYVGGGLFVDGKRYVPYGWNPDNLPPGFSPEAIESNGFWETESSAASWTSYTKRLELESWKFHQGKTQHECHYQKQLVNGWTLRKWRTHGGSNKALSGSEHEEHLLLHQSGKEIDGTTWEWADWEPVRNRFAWAAEGKLFGAKLNTGGLREVQPLYDFNPMKFQAIEAPY